MIKKIPGCIPWCGSTTKCNRSIPEPYRNNLLIGRGNGVKKKLLKTKQWPLNFCLKGFYNSYRGSYLWCWKLSSTCNATNHETDAATGQSWSAEDYANMRDSHRVIERKEKKEISFLSSSLQVTSPNFHPSIHLSIHTSISPSLPVVFSGQLWLPWGHWWDSLSSFGEHWLVLTHPGRKLKRIQNTFCIWLPCILN